MFGHPRIRLACLNRKIGVATTIVAEPKSQQVRPQGTTVARDGIKGLYGTFRLRSQVYRTVRPNTSGNDTPYRRTEGHGSGSRFLH